MIKVEISKSEIESVTSNLKPMEINTWLCDKLKNSGVPTVIINRTIQLDYSKGELKSWNEEDKKVFLWVPNKTEKGEME